MEHTFWLNVVHCTSFQYHFLEFDRSVLPESAIWQGWSDDSHGAMEWTLCGGWSDMGDRLVGVLCTSASANFCQF